jgi:uncharacterized membrane protein
MVDVRSAVSNSAPGVGSPKRLESLNDGIFAIVMTLIVLGVRVPGGPDSTLVSQIGEVLPTLLTYFLTFVTLGILWFGNRAQSEYLRVANHPLVWLNLLFLSAIALVPFSAALLARYPTSRFAVVEYGVHLTVASVIHGLTWLYALGHPALLNRSLTSRYRRVSRFTTFAPAAGFVLATGVGALFPLAGLIAFVLVPVPFVSGIYYRRLAAIDSVGPPVHAED